MVEQVKKHECRVRERFVREDSAATYATCYLWLLVACTVCRTYWRLGTGNQSRGECGQEKQGFVMRCWSEESRVQRTKHVATTTSNLDPRIILHLVLL